MFADADFILALIKKTDWLKNNAMNLLRNHRGKIRTSTSVMIEIALVCKRFGLDIPKAFANIFEVIKVDEETYSISMRAALYIEKYGLNVFDAFHAASCGDDLIISSDTAYEKVGLKRVKLET